MTTKKTPFDTRFRFALLDYRISKLGITPRLTSFSAAVEPKRFVRLRPSTTGTFI